MVYDITIIGAGIIGLSAAYQIKNRYPDLKILIIEKETTIASHQTGHNSGVIHSGVFYKTGSSKAKNCINGYHMLLQFAQEKSIPYTLIGKLIVATKKKELEKLFSIYQNGLNNGLQIRKISKEEVKELEPNVTCLGAIEVPQTGIIHYPTVAHTMYKELVGNGTEIILGKKLTNIQSIGNTIYVTTEDQMEYLSRFLINCAGLQSDRISKLAGIDTPYRIIPFKGMYYQLKAKKRDMVERLIYPVPDPNFPFLGIHYTRLLSGELTLGPNAVLVLDREAYSPGGFNSKDALEILNYGGFYKLIARHWNVGLGEYIRNYSKNYFAKKAAEMTPGIIASDLLPFGSGIRAQVIDRNGNMVDDFVVIKKQNMIHMVNAPSPAATACLSIGLQICDWYTELNMDY